MRAEPALGVGDLVTCRGRGQDVWELVRVRHGLALIAARSIHLERGRMRSVPLEHLARYEPGGVDVCEAPPDRLPAPSGRQVAGRLAEV